MDHKVRTASSTHAGQVNQVPRLWEDWKQALQIIPDTGKQPESQPSGFTYTDVRSETCPALNQRIFSFLLQCTLDSEVALRVGGEFFFDPQPTDAPRNLILIAGGVGINPLLSILRHSADLHRDHADKGRSYEIGTVKLFYSAKNTSELLFKVRWEICLQ